MKGTPSTQIKRRSKGFRQAGALLETRVRRAGETRGFAVSRLLTHWDEIAGPQIAEVARPVEVAYGRGGFGATLVLLTKGAHAPMVQMQEAALRERINACYGYAAITRIRLTQTAATGFETSGLAEEAAPFGAAPAAAARVRPAPSEHRQAVDLAADVNSDDLRRALETLGASVLAKSARAGRGPNER
ncbi:MAG: DUF721 domain-containing protein [Pseudomonadota bacterium]